MENNKKKFFIIGGIIVAVIVVVIIIFMIFGSKSGGLLGVTNKNYIDKDAVNADWMNYLLNQDITKIELLQKGTYTENPNEDINTRKRATLTVDDLKNILTDVQNYNITKMYALSLGENNNVRLSVTYEKNEKAYLFELSHGSILVEQCDPVLQTTIASKEYPEMYVEFKDMEGAITFYSIDGLMPTYFDQYFK